MVESSQEGLLNHEGGCQPPGSRRFVITRKRTLKSQSDSLIKVMRILETSTRHGRSQPELLHMDKEGY